jgi:2-dehydropantoate 2-reductase
MDMRFLIVGAGALGGYFGGRLIDAGRDVTFLLRARRAAQIARTGLVVRSPVGDLHIPSPPHLLADQLSTPFDVVMVGCKAFDLDETMESFAAAVGPNTVILPMLNGLRHVDRLAERFGSDKVIGGLCMISATLDADGTVLHLNELHGLTYGERDGTISPRIQAIEAQFKGANFNAVASRDILQDMWEKWAFIAATAGLTSLMRASVGDIMSAGGRDIALAIVGDCAAIAAHNGHPLREPALQRMQNALTAVGSPMTASMYRDLLLGGKVEADHVIGDLLARAPQTEATTPSVLRTAYVHLKAYEAQRTTRARSGEVRREAQPLASAASMACCRCVRPKDTSTKVPLR